MRIVYGVRVCVFLLIPTALASQGNGAQRLALASWVQLDVPTGYETRVAPALAAKMPGWHADQWGNLIASVGSGTPRRVVACALDRPSYAVSQITDDGYLRVHRIGRGSRHPLWDQAFEAQHVRILTADGPIAGVIARTNAHFGQQHRNETAIVTADDLWVDVGAESAEEVAALGIQLLDPIGRHLPPWAFAGEIAGPDAGRRVSCAVVATLAEAARQGPTPPGETVFVLSAQEGFGWVGLSSFVARSGPLDELIGVGPGQVDRIRGERPLGSDGLSTVLAASGLDAVMVIAPAVHSPGSHMERIEVDEAHELLQAVASAAEIAIPSGLEWLPAPERESLRIERIDPSLTPVASLLTELVERYGVSEHEWSVRRLVLESLPEWARKRAVVDDVGNIAVAIGPDRDTTVFIAHMDEVGYEVDSIAADGVVTLRPQGGVASSAWEGQTALLHFDPAGAPSTRSGKGADTSARWRVSSLSATAALPLRGVILTRDEARQKDPGTLQAWFGLDAKALAERGVQVGAAVTSYKEGLRLGVHRFTARALDDRAGTTALVLAVSRLDTTALRGKVIFAWSVHEEGGLVGAAALARRFGTSTRRVYSVDTFVASDTPLESPHFAFTPLGNGPVLRAIENSGVSPDAERARVRRAAASAGIPLQVGLTQGGTDGTRFTFWGAPNQGLSWPGRYSHSPGEVLDLRDLARLSELIVAVATVRDE